MMVGSRQSIGRCAAGKENVMYNKPQHLLVGTLALAALLPLAGCRVYNSHANGQHDVDIATPFGGLKVKTDQAGEGAATGISVYPGAVPEHKHGEDSGSADVEMSFGKFQLRVKAASYLTDDSTEKVTAFYHNDLKRYGEVLTCAGNTPVGQPTTTLQGLTCNDDSGGKHVHIDKGDGVQLKTGSPRHQHIVGIEQKDGRTHLDLVALELPRDFSASGDQSE